MGQAGSFCAFYLGPVLSDALGGTKAVFTVACGLSLTALTCLGIARILEKTSKGKRNTHTPGAARAYTSDIEMHHTVGVMHSSAGALAAAVVDQADLQLASARKTAETALHHGHGYGATASTTKSLPIKWDDHGEAVAWVKPADAATPEEEQKLMAAAAAAAAADDEMFEEEEDDEGLIETSGARAVRAKCCTRRLGPIDRLLAAMGIYHLLALQWDFWAVLAGIACYSSAAYSLLAFGNDWLQVDHGFDDHGSGQALGIISIFSMVVSPSIGLLMDKRGGQRYACFFAMSGLCATFACLGFTKLHPIAGEAVRSHRPLRACPRTYSPHTLVPRRLPSSGLVLVGLFYSICPSALYPLLTETVPEESFVVVYAIVNGAPLPRVSCCFTSIAHLHPTPMHAPHFHPSVVHVQP